VNEKAKCSLVLHSSKAYLAEVSQKRCRNKDCNDFRDANPQLRAAAAEERDECPDDDLRAKMAEANAKAAGCLTCTEFIVLQYKQQLSHTRRHG
jgi:hypothetical protein